MASQCSPIEFLQYFYIKSAILIVVLSVLASCSSSSGEDSGTSDNRVFVQRPILISNIPQADRDLVGGSFYTNSPSSAIFQGVQIDPVTRFPELNYAQDRVSVDIQEPSSILITQSYVIRNNWEPELVAVAYNPTQQTHCSIRMSGATLLGDDGLPTVQQPFSEDVFLQFGSNIVSGFDDDDSEICLLPGQRAYFSLPMGFGIVSFLVFEDEIPSRLSINRIETTIVSNAVLANSIVPVALSYRTVDSMGSTVADVTFLNQGDSFLALTGWEILIMDDSGLPLSVQFGEARASCIEPGTVVTLSTSSFSHTAPRSISARVLTDSEPQPSSACN